jgi:hypothetical protein
MKRRLISKLTAIICILILGLSTALAAGSDENTHENTLTIICKNTDGSKAIVGIELKAYNVGSKDAYGNYTLKSAYSTVKTPTSQTTVSELTGIVSDIAEIIKANEVGIDYTAKSDNDGNAVFENISDGIYVILGEPVEYDGYKYTIKPLFVEVSSSLKPNNSVDISAVAKVSEELIPVVEEPSPTPTDTPTPTPTATPSATPSASPAPTNPEATPTDTPVPSSTPTATPTPNLDEDTASGKDQITPGISQDDSTLTGENQPTPTPTEVEAKLPQTGQLWWPVPVLFAAGIIFIGIGIRLSKKEN